MERGNGREKSEKYALVMESDDSFGPIRAYVELRQGMLDATIIGDDERRRERTVQSKRRIENQSGVGIGRTDQFFLDIGQRIIDIVEIQQPFRLEPAYGFRRNHNDIGIFLAGLFIKICDFFLVFFYAAGSETVLQKSDFHCVMDLGMLYVFGLSWIRT